MKVSAGFHPKTTFSELRLSLDPYKSEGLKDCMIQFGELLNFDKDMFSRPDKCPDNLKEPVMHLTTFMKRCKNIPWPAFHAIPITKEDHMIDIARVILHPLCTDVVLERRYVKKL